MPTTCVGYKTGYMKGRREVTVLVAALKVGERRERGKKRERERGKKNSVVACGLLLYCKRNVGVYSG